MNVGYDYGFMYFNDNRLIHSDRTGIATRIIRIIVTFPFNRLIVGSNRTLPDNDSFLIHSTRELILIDNRS